MEKICLHSHPIHLPLFRNSRPPIPFTNWSSWKPTGASSRSNCSNPPRANTRANDWGLHAGTGYHYIVTAVNASGHESQPCTEVVAETPLIERVLQHIAVEKPLGATPVSVSFDVPHDGQYLLWAELQAQHVTSNEKIAVLLDGAKRPIFRPMWDYVTTGWDNPAGTPFFDTLKSDGQTNPWYALKAGSHHLEFTLPTGTAEIVSFTATNDAGYLPEGISSFHHPPLKH